MTDHLMPWQKRQALRDKLATMPPGADHNGKTDLDRAQAAETATRLAEPDPVTVTEQAPMQPNPAQGSTGVSVAPPAPTDPLAAVRAQAAKHL